MYASRRMHRSIRDRVHVDRCELRAAEQHEARAVEGRHPTGSARGGPHSWRHAVVEVSRASEPSSMAARLTAKTTAFARNRLIVLSRSELKVDERGAGFRPEEQDPDGQPVVGRPADPDRLLQKTLDPVAAPAHVDASPRRTAPSATPADVYGPTSNSRARVPEMPVTRCVRTYSASPRLSARKKIHDSTTRCTVANTCHARPRRGMAAPDAVVPPLPNRPGADRHGHVDAVKQPPDHERPADAVPHSRRRET